MAELTDPERESLHHVANGDAQHANAEHLERLYALGLIERDGDGWKATEAGRVEAIPRPEHL